MAALKVGRGSPLPLGATLRPEGINFAIFSRHATDVTLVLLQPGDQPSPIELKLDSRINRTGDIWHALVRGLEPGVLYNFRIGRYPCPNPAVYRCDPEAALLDPYARGVTVENNEVSRRWGAVPVDKFDWGLDQPLSYPLADSIIYELHVRGFTQHPSSAAERPGTFLGLTEKIPHLKELGVTAVELLPVHDFEETFCDRVNPATGARLRNYWGYDPISFFAPKCSYSAEPRPADEFREMVKRFHAAGIEVILDVVFNHTAEGDEHGPTFSFRGIDNPVYYLVDPETGAYRNYSGWGNTLNCNHPVVRSLILDALRYWLLRCMWTDSDSIWRPYWAGGGTVASWPARRCWRTCRPTPSWRIPS